MNDNTVVESLHPLERKVLPALQKTKNLQELAKATGLNEIEVLRALNWLKAKHLVSVNETVSEILELDENGRTYAKKGLPEKRLLDALGNKELAVAEAASKAGLSKEEEQAVLGILRQKGLVLLRKDKELLIKRIKKVQEWPEEKLLRKLPIDASSLSQDEKDVLEKLRKRRTILRLELKKTTEAVLTSSGKELIKLGIRGEVIEQVTPELIQSGSWKGKSFRRFDISMPVPNLCAGRLHPLQETINQVRRIFMNMGFKEMDGPLIETAFWCMDSMWIPQDHPARESQDTFYLPYQGTIPKDFAKKVAVMHETGGKTGSKGYGYKWNEELAKQLLLRTHTTATTFRFFGEKKPKFPAKYFYIGRIFRNEAIDATHLPEFHQSEGFIMDEGLTLRDLMGYIKEFYGLMGIHKIKFKPTYNPYTEPSMEAIGYNEQLGRWVELINSGIFRPEALEPYGITVPVIAWGLGIERLAMMLSNQKDIRNMLGATGDLNWFRDGKVMKKW